MKLKYFISILTILFIAGAAVFWMNYTKPYDLPEVTANGSVTDFNLDFSTEKETVNRETGNEEENKYYEALEQIEHKNKEEGIRQLKEIVKENPENMVFSNQLRLVLTNEEKYEEALEFFNSIPVESSRLELQKALVFIDNLQQPSLGTASLGQKSTQSIAILDDVIEENNNDWMAHYARGLNNLYWPVGLQRTKKSIQDLSFCVSVAENTDIQHDTLFAEAYTAYGDALIKDGQINEGYQVWKDGFEKYPESESLRERANLSKDDAQTIVQKERGIDNFMKPSPELTDLSKFW
ncbi:tetratricopeptide repeat protein [Virgibacillus senegalensis]|uniref:hypothetical protein n=1 Tax=Virgibacillus senegalensis TaxID=1499679 RepID=UPI00069E847F|nr:hypothetical protein [Virgibacillus senegalensis]